MDRIVIVLVILCFASVFANISLLVQVLRARRTVLAAHALVEDVVKLRLQFDSMRALLKRINSRDAMREFREREKGDQPSTYKRKIGGLDRPPDWRTDPVGFRQYHEGRLHLRNKEPFNDP